MNAKPFVPDHPQTQQLLLQLKVRQAQLNNGIFRTQNRSSNMNKRMEVAGVELKRLSNTDLSPKILRSSACHALLLPKRMPKDKNGIAGWKSIDGWKMALFAAMTSCDDTTYIRALGVCAMTRDNMRRNTILRDMFEISMTCRASRDTVQLVKDVYNHL